MAAFVVVVVVVVVKSRGEGQQEDQQMKILGPFWSIPEPRIAPQDVTSQLLGTGLAAEALAASKQLRTQRGFSVARPWGFSFAHRFLRIGHETSSH